MMEKVEYIDVRQIHPNPDNPRKDLGDLSELTASIRANGVLQNLTVTSDGGKPETFTVIIGHRRLAAAKAAGLERVPCIVTDMDREEAVKTMLVENMQRSDLTVYEQAQGFQMMLDLGVPVGEIARRSGFSETTVRRRVKMAELDQQTLREVSTRQISLGDFDRLAEIKDIGARNAALKEIGTNNFSWAVNRALLPQKRKENRPKVKAWLQMIGAQEVPKEEQHSGKYEIYPGAAYYISIADWETEKLPEITEPAFYTLDSESLHLMRRCKGTPKAPKPKTEEEIRREKAVAKAWAELSAASEAAYTLRRNFVEKLVLTQHNRADILKGALYAGILAACCYNGCDRLAIRDILGVTEASYSHVMLEQIGRGLDVLRDKDLPKLVYAMFGDSRDEMCVKYKVKSQFPEYEEEVELSILYGWLTELGYKVSDTEAELLFGRHESYRAKKAFEAGTGAEA